MNKSQALRLLIAAQDDPVVAAWASVVHEYKMAASADVSPYEHWEAFEQFFSHGLISLAQYDGVDSKRVFFSGRRPPEGEVQSCLNNLKLLGSEHDRVEVPVSKTKLTANPFSENAISTRGSNGSGMERTHQGAALPAMRSGGSLNPFASGPSELPFASRPSLGENAFAQRSEKIGLPCVAPTDRTSVNPEMYCCGTQLNMTNEGGQTIGPDDLPGGQVNIVEAIFYGQCSRCSAVWHCSVGQTVQQEAFR